MKTYFFFLSLVYSSVVLAQTGLEGFNYQGVLFNNAADTVVSSTSISINASVYQDGLMIYSEDHTTTTDDQGRFSINIGTGASLSPPFENINWANGTYATELLIEIDSNLYSFGPDTIYSVPYAQFAKSVQDNSIFFSAHNTLGTSLAPGPAQVTVIYSTENFDNTNSYNPINGIFTAPRSGVYQLHANVCISAPPGVSIDMSTVFEIFIMDQDNAIHGKNFWQNANTFHPGDVCLNVNSIVVAEEGDQYRVAIRNSIVTSVSGPVNLLTGSEPRFWGASVSF
jgi:hypothetical protein